MTTTNDILDDLLSDPMIQLVMARDRVHPQDVRMLFEGARKRTFRQETVLPAHVIQACKLQGICA